MHPNHPCIREVEEHGSQVLRQQDVGIEKEHRRPPREDAHVAAAALKLTQRGDPVVLVTHNTRHLPKRAFEGLAIRVTRPGSVLRSLLKHDLRVAVVLEQMLARLNKPQLRREDLLAILDASGCSGFATALARYWVFVSR